MPKQVLTKNLPRDVFLYLLSIISLIISAVSFEILFFQYVDIYLPDLISDPYFSKSAYFSTIRTALATLVVIFPVYFWVTWFLKKDIAEFPEKRELKIRKWLLYLTLFVAALVIIGDLIVLIQSFLNGELTLRFILKILSIIFIAGSVFGYYYYELKEKEQTDKIRKSFTWLIISAVAVTIVAGFWIAGSPQSQRLVRFDERRIMDLQLIQGEIINYWQNKSKLPVSSEDLRNDISGFMAPNDPETGQPYEYRVSGELQFQLCGVFSTSGFTDGRGLEKTMAVPIRYPTGVGMEANYNWQHGLGRYCFDRTIDPDFYPPLNKTPEVKIKQ